MPLFTRDGYSVTAPGFRVRRLERRLRTRHRDDPRLRAAARTLALLVGRARRSGPLPGERGRSHPMFTSRLGRTRVVLLTRALGPRAVELLLVRREAAL